MLAGAMQGRRHELRREVVEPHVHGDPHEQWGKQDQCGVIQERRPAVLAFGFSETDRPRLIET